MNEALFNRNADACERAQHPKCTCLCGGAFHGVKHSATWRTETFAQLVTDIEKTAQAAGGNLDLFAEEAQRAGGAA